MTYNFSAITVGCFIRAIAQSVGTVNLTTFGVNNNECLSNQNQGKAEENLHVSFKRKLLFTPPYIALICEFASQMVLLGFFSSLLSLPEQVTLQLKIITVQSEGERALASSPGPELEPSIS